MEYWVLYLCSIADSVHTLLMVLSNHSEEVQRIPDNAMKAVNRYLESLAPNDSIQ